MCCEPRNHHSLDTLELWAISAEQKSNMCADALVLRVIIVIKIQPLGAFEKLTFLLHCFVAPALLFFFNNTRHAARATGWNHSNQGCFSKDSALVHRACSLPGGLPGHLHILTVDI